MTLRLSVATHNVGGESDSERLMDLLKEKGSAVDWYKSRISHVYDDQMLSHDIICFQEFHAGTPEKQPLCQIIEKGGYTIKGQRNGDGDLAIAFKTDKFIFKEASNTHRNYGAFFVRLQEKAIGKSICVVSDHLSGFDARKHKYYTHALKSKTPIQTDALTNNPWDAEVAAAYKKDAIGEADQSLTKTLNFLDQEKSDLIIYAGDFNGTDKYEGLQNRVHPKRVRQLTDKNFIRDTKDSSPTVIDHKLKASDMDKEGAANFKNEAWRYNVAPEVPVKYDYILARAKEGTIIISSNAGGPEPHEFDQLLSDHRPVFATIELKEPIFKIWKVISVILGFTILGFVGRFFFMRSLLPDGAKVERGE